MRPSSSIVRWITAGSAALALAVGVASLPAVATQAAATTTYTVYNTPVKSFDGSEIVDVALSSNGRFALLVGGNDDPNPAYSNQRDVKVRVLNVLTREKVPQSSGTSLDLRAAFGSEFGIADADEPVASSVAAHPTANYALVTVRAKADSETRGKVFFIAINPTTGVLSPLDGASPVQVGVYPEHVAIAPEGNYALVANSDERVGQAGTISLIDLRPTSPTRFQVIDTITPTVPGPTQERPTFRQSDPAPETVAISPNSRRAFVTLQPNNAITIIDISASLAATHTTVGLPYKFGEPNVPSSPPLFPDGIAVTPNGQYIITANEGDAGVRANSVSMFRVDAGPSLTRVAEVRDPGLVGGDNPEMVVIGTIGGQTRAYVTLEGPDAVAALRIDEAAGALSFEERILLNRTGQPAARDPEGIAIAKVNGGEFIVTANVATKNVSVIQATTTSPTPTPSPPPSGQNRVYLPLVTR